MPDFGTDISTDGDLDASFTPLSGHRVLLEACARRLQTPRGSLWAHPDYGLDLRSWLNDGFTAAAQASMAAAIESELEKDERVRVASVAASLDNRAGTLRVEVSVTTADGPFRLVLSVSRLSVDLIYPE